MTGTAKVRKSTLTLTAGVTTITTAAAIAIVCGDVTAHAFGVGLLGIALAVIGLAWDNRRTARVITAAVARAPQESYWRGYGVGASDALDPKIGEDTTDLAPL